MFDFNTSHGQAILFFRFFGFSKRLILDKVFRFSRGLISLTYTSSAYHILFAALRKLLKMRRWPSLPGLSLGSSPYLLRMWGKSMGLSNKILQTHQNQLIIPVPEPTQTILFTFRETSKVPQPCLEHGLGIGEIQEVDGLRLELGEGGDGEGGRLHGEEAALLEHEVLHHPVGDVDLALVRHELEDAAVGGAVGLVEIQE